MPTPAAMSLSDVPSYPVVAKQVTASSRIDSRVVRGPAADVLHPDGRILGHHATLPDDCPTDQ